MFKDTQYNCVLPRLSVLYPLFASYRDPHKYRFVAHAVRLYLIYISASIIITSLLTTVKDTGLQTLLLSLSSLLNRLIPMQKYSMTFSDVIKICVTDKHFHKLRRGTAGKLNEFFVRLMNLIEEVNTQGLDKSPWASKWELLSNHLRDIDQKNNE